MCKKYTILGSEKNFKLISIEKLQTQSVFDRSVGLGIEFVPVFKASPGLDFMNESRACQLAY